jgi:hypothetical protein
MEAKMTDRIIDFNDPIDFLDWDTFHLWRDDLASYKLRDHEIRALALELGMEPELLISKVQGGRDAKERSNG